MARLLVATGNLHKLEEIAAILEGHPVELVGLERYPGLPEPVESGDSYVENARIKARHYHELTGEVTLADDSGLEVDALDGRPGLHSARFGGEGLPHPEKIRLLLEMLREVSEERRSARFRCVAVVAHEGGELVSEGMVEGRIGYVPRGEGGFGYDPIFLLPDRGLTMAELPADEKNRVSHRARALAGLAPRLQAAGAARDVV